MGFKEGAARHVAIIGFGEVGACFARGLLDSGVARIIVYSADTVDAKNRLSDFDDRGAKILLASKIEDAVRSARIVFVAVPCTATLSVAQKLASVIGEGTLVADLCTASPDTKRSCAHAVEAAGCRYLDVALMETVSRAGIRTPALASGNSVWEDIGSLRALGMEVDVFEGGPGAAMTVKLCRSVFMKGVAALAIETSRIARIRGVEDEVFKTLGESFDGVDTVAYLKHLMNAADAHAARQAAEAAEALEMEHASGFEGLMTEATVSVLSGLLYA